MNDFLVEAEVVPLWARRRGLTRCFFYTGSSMTPTFREGHILYVAPEARDLAVGDVVVFFDPLREVHVVHRIVAPAEEGWITQGDNNQARDLYPVTPRQLVGRVELAQDARRVARVAGRRWGLWRARAVHTLWQLRQQARPALEPLYWKLCYSPKLRWLLRRLAGRRLRVLRLRSEQGPWLKVLLGQRVIAYWRPGQAEPGVYKPYDLLVLREQVPEPGETSNVKRQT